MIAIADWSLIRRLLVNERLPKAEIARQLGTSRDTVAKAIGAADRPGYSGPSAVTSFVPFEVHIRLLLLATPSMPATVLADRVW